MSKFKKNDRIKVVGNKTSSSYVEVQGILLEVHNEGTSTCYWEIMRDDTKTTISVYEDALDLISSNYNLIRIIDNTIVDILEVRALAILSIDKEYILE